MMTDKQTDNTDRQTYAGDSIIPRESFRGDNYTRARKNGVRSTYIIPGRAWTKSRAALVQRICKDVKPLCQRHRNWGTKGVEGHGKWREFLLDLTTNPWQNPRYRKKSNLISKNFPLFYAVITRWAESTCCLCLSNSTVAHHFSSTLVHFLDTKPLSRPWITQYICIAPGPLHHVSTMSTVERKYITGKSEAV